MGFFRTACEDGLCVGKGWLIYIRIQQLRTCIRLTGAMTLTLERGVSSVERKQSRANSEMLHWNRRRGLPVTSWFSIYAHAYAWIR